MARQPFDPDRVHGPSETRLPPEVESIAKRVIGAAIEMHRALGPGFQESVYEEAMAHELYLRQIPFVRQAPVLVTYKGTAVGQGRIDLLVADKLVVELKAIQPFTAVHPAQVVAYLKACDRRLGLLINFNVPVLKYGLKRVIL